MVHDTGSQRVVRTNHGEADVVCLGEREQPGGIRDGERDVLAEQRRARVAGRAVDFFDPGRERQLPREGVFPPAAADDENVHAGEHAGWEWEDERKFAAAKHCRANVPLAKLRGETVLLRPSLPQNFERPLSKLGKRSACPTKNLSDATRRCPDRFSSTGIRAQSRP